MATKMSVSGKVAVRYASGREDQYDVELYGGGSTGELRLKELLKAPAVLLQTETELLIIPWAAVERVTIALPQLSGKQEPLPGVRKARRLT
jgi:hypothetical protein